MAWTRRLLGLGLLVVACQSPPVERSPSADTGASKNAAGSAEAPLSASAVPPIVPANSLSEGEFTRLFHELSEPDRYFFSDNFVSNETSYLQPIAELSARAAKGGAYLGVGPEQNFSYLALLEPKLAFIVDIRRANALEHLLYKAIFEEATSRSHFVALLLARDYDAETDPGPSAPIKAVLAHATRSTPDPKRFLDLHAMLVKKLQSKGLSFGAEDQKTLTATHRAFFDRGLELSFELHDKNGRKYPRLSELLSAEDSRGSTGFLGTEAAFRTVQQLQRDNRIIPVVGDFAGDHAILRIAAELRRRALPVSVFYTSNVEQYLMEPDKWKAWTRNVEALPSNEKSLFLRCYLDQGRRHPLQLQGHRTATVVASFDHFKWRNKTRGYGSFFQLVTDGLGADAGH